MIKLLFIADREIPRRLFTPLFIAELEKFGSVTLLPHGCKMSPAERLSHLQAADVALCGWGASALPTELALVPGRLRYVLHLTGTMAQSVPPEIIRAGIPVTNWGDAPAESVAEGALCLLLASLKNLPRHVLTVREGGWGVRAKQGSLCDLSVGIYGLGAIGRRFCELCAPFRPRLTVFDPYAEPFPGATRVDSLEALFEDAHAIVIHAALTPATRHSVTKTLLARLPDGGVVINTARGGLIDQTALWAELASGRLRAGLDVVDGDDHLAPDDPARQWPNLILSSHQIGRTEWPEHEASTERSLSSLHRIALENLRRFVAGQPLLHQMTEARYALST